MAVEFAHDPLDDAGGKLGPAAVAEDESAGVRVGEEGEGGWRAARRWGVQLRLAIGLVARRRAGKRTIVRAELLAATLNEDSDAIGDLLADV